MSYELQLSKAFRQALAAEQSVIVQEALIDLVDDLAEQAATPTEGAFAAGIVPGVTSHRFRVLGDVEFDGDVIELTDHKACVVYILLLIARPSNRPGGA